MKDSSCGVLSQPDPARPEAIHHRRTLTPTGYHRLGAAYVEPYETQLLHFPAGHDDMVSAGAIAARWMADGFGQTAVISISKRAPRYGV